MSLEANYRISAEPTDLTIGHGSSRKGLFRRGLLALFVMTAVALAGVASRDEAIEPEPESMAAWLDQDQNPLAARMPSRRGNSESTRVPVGERGTPRQKVDVAVR